MTTKHLIDSEIREFCISFPVHDYTNDVMPAMREGMASMLGEIGAPPETVIREKITMPGYKGEPDVSGYIYKPRQPKNNAPTYLHIHGGGMILGAPEHTDERCVRICDTFGITVLSTSYRLAPENPYPAALHDCYAALTYLHSSAKPLGIDPARIAIGGESAGGGLAASLAIFARDQGEYPICHQQLVFPMIDNRTGAADHEIDPNLGEFIWTTENNQYGWTSYLGDTPAEKAIIPARAENLSGLPPAWIGVGDLDLFFTENKAYAQGLIDANISVTFDVYKGAPHGFYLAPESQLSRTFEVDFMHSLARGLGISN